MNGYYKVETEIEKSNIIQSIKLYDDISELVTTISRRIINTEEQQIREALIKLGWTPPANEY